ncbi:2-C-methyl-D-erythritol 2,4-cyclodiphosphate synthase [bacterium]|nr:MAG: 2-C-methyl-D-erythritol 2,4-cyclodiphosphate synthase [bacterium]
MDLRIGQGIDRHRLVAGRRLVIGGVAIEHSHGLDGHSDADLLLHAICDAMLGAAALGDIGQMFSDTDARNAGRSSLEFLAAVHQRITEHGFSVRNIDSTVMIEAPKLAPHIDEMRQNIADTLALSPDHVSVKATRGEGVGPEGRSEAATAHAVVLLGEAAKA